MSRPNLPPIPEQVSADMEDSFVRRLLHRWFVEYNPLYLLSASLVLGGMILLSRGLARTGSVHGELVVAAIAEVYAITLIGGAALLTRIGYRRPAVMLTLLTVLYQCDLTLHTETCAHLGTIGLWASAAWVGLFVGKLRGLAWAMKLRLSNRALATATLGAAGLALLPPMTARLEPRPATALVALWLSALVVFYQRGAVTSLVDLDSWGHTVLRRAVRASWLLGALLFALHVLFWSAHYPIDLAILAGVLPVLATRWIRTESRVWPVVGATLLLFALKLPDGFSIVALVAALTLGVRAVAAARSPDTISAERSHREPATPYRVPGGAVHPSHVGAAAPVPPALDPETVVPGGRAAMLRLATGAATALYLALWTSQWAGGPWPAHVIALDLLFAGLAILAVWKLRVRLALGPLSATCLHLVVQSRLVPAPRTLLEWGGAAVGLGFVLLLASLATSYWLRWPKRAPEAAPPGSRPDT